LMNIGEGTLLVAIARSAEVTAEAEAIVDGEVVDGEVVDAEVVTDGEETTEAAAETTTDPSGASNEQPED
jgi:DNA gyrase subunit A